MCIRDRAHVGIISIEQILAALVVLDMKGAELAVQLLCRDTQLLCYLRGGIAGNRVEHIVGVERLRQKMIHLIDVYKRQAQPVHLPEVSLGQRTVQNIASVFRRW